MEVGQVSARLSLDASSYQTGMAAARKQIESMGTELDKLGQKATQPSWAQAFRQNAWGKASPGGVVDKSTFSASGDLKALEVSMARIRMRGVQTGAALKKSADDVRTSVRAAKDEMAKPQQLTQLKGQIGGVEMAMRRLKMYFGAYLGFEGIRRLGMSFIDTAKNMESYRQRLRAVIKDQAEADRTFERMVRWAAESPITTDEAVGAFVQMKAAAVDNAEEAAVAVANLASVMNRDMRDVAASMISGETEALRRLGIVVQRNGKNATVQSGEFKRVIVDDMAEIRKAIISVVQLNYADALKNRAGTFSGVVEIIRGQVELVRKDIMGLDTGSPFRNLTNTFRSFASAIDNWSKGPGYRDFVRGFQTSLNGAIDGLKALGKAGAAVWSTGAVTSIASWALAMKGAQVALNGASAAMTAFTKARVAGEGISLFSPETIIALGTLAALYGIATTKPGSKSYGGYAGIGDTPIRLAADEAKRFAEEQERLRNEERKQRQSMLLSYGGGKQATDYDGIYKQTFVPFDQKLKDVAQDIAARYREEYEKATEYAQKFGLNATEIGAKVAENFKSSMDAEMKNLKSAYGEAAFPALIKDLERRSEGSPFLKSLIKQLKEAKDEVAALHSKYRELTAPAGDVAKAYQKGLIPKAEAEKYLQGKITEASGINRQLADEQYRGLSATARSGIAKMWDADLVESFGMKRLSQRGTGGWQPQPGTIGYAGNPPLERQAPLSPLPANLDRYGGEFNYRRMQESAESRARIEAANAKGPTYNVTINGMTISGAKGERMGTILIEGVKAGGLSIAGAAQ